MRRVAFALTLGAALGGATSAGALSCMRVEPADAFAQAAEAAEPYIVVHGRFSFDKAALPQSHAEGVRSAAVPARFTGSGLNQDGFSVPLSMAVTLDVQCLGPWCGGLATDADYLAFVERRDTGYTLTVGACPGRVFSNPDDATLDLMQTCMTDGCQAG